MARGAPAPAAPRAAQEKKRGPPLDQLPYQRKFLFLQRAHRTLEDRLHALFLDAPDGAGELRVALGRVVGRSSGREVALPVAGEALLDGQDHEFAPALSTEASGALQSALDAALARWQAEDAARRRWAAVAVEERSRRHAEVGESLTVYQPEGSWHYQVGLYGAPSGAGGTGVEGTERRYCFRKEQGDCGLWWAVALGRRAGQCTCELSVNMRFLLEQRQRLRNGKIHGVSLVLRDLLRNARALCELLRQSAVARSQDGSQFYYPVLLEPAMAVQDFYARKASAQVPESPNEKVRRYNNLVKTLIIEKFVDVIEGNVRVLDVACGQGQDLYKYSRCFRRADVESYVGVDFAEAAVVEARRRHATLLQTKSSRERGEYAAHFYVGDVRHPGTLDKLSPHGPFDVMAMQFCLHYLAESEEAVRTLFSRLRGLLKPGGKVLGTVPNSDQLAALFNRHSAAEGPPGPVGNDLYAVRFREGLLEKGATPEVVDDAFATRWGISYTFTLVDAVEAQEEYAVPWEAFEELIGTLGFRVLLDAPFKEVFDGYSKSSPFYAGHFSKDPRNTDLTAAEREVFDFYNAFVIEYAGPPADAERGA